MNVRDDVLSLQHDNIDNLALIPKHIDRSRIILKIEKTIKRILDIIGGLCGIELCGGLTNLILGTGKFPTLVGIPLELNILCWTGLSKS